MQVYQHEVIDAACKQVVKMIQNRFQDEVPGAVQQDGFGREEMARGDH